MNLNPECANYEHCIQSQIIEMFANIGGRTANVDRNCDDCNLCNISNEKENNNVNC